MFNKINFQRGTDFGCCWMLPLFYFLDGKSLYLIPSKGIKIKLLLPLAAVSLSLSLAAVSLSLSFAAVSLSLSLHEK